MTVQVVSEDVEALHQQLQLLQVPQLHQAQQVFLRLPAEEPGRTKGGNFLPLQEDRWVHGAVSEADRILRVLSWGNSIGILLQRLPLERF